MRYLICVVTMILIVPASARGQSPNATLRGQVLDSAAGAIAGAEIGVVNTATNVRYSTKTNAEGMYVLPELPPANYEIQVSHSGFKTIVKPDVLMNVRDAVVINFTLPIGAVSERVTVEAGASMINTTDASVSTVVDQTYIKNMPLNGRSFQDLILLAPGTVTTSPQNGSGSAGLGQTGEFSVNGQRTESNNYTVDGVSANVGQSAVLGTFTLGGASGSVPALTALGTTQALVSVDALQEFRVQSSTYSAEYGRNPGGQFAFETKSGTNQWHATAYEYVRNNFFDANDWFNNYFGLKEPALRQNDFGGTLGGPVRIPRLYNGNDKTFFFVSYEGLRLMQPQAAAVSNVPDTALRASAPSPLNQALNAFPVQSPNGIDQTASGVAQFIGTWSNPSSINSTSFRFDHVVSDKLRLFFRFGDTGSNSAIRGFGGVSPTVNTILAYALQTYTAGATSVFTHRLNNEFRLNYSSNEATNNALIDAFGGSTPVDLRKLAGLGPLSSPCVCLSSIGSIGPLQAQGGSATQRQWNLVDTVSLSLGRHQFKFGVDYRRLAPFAIQPTPIASYEYSSKSNVATNGASIFVDALAPAYPLYKNFSAFAQDEWRALPRLSFSLGLRWEVNPPPGVTQGLEPYTIQGSGPDTWTLAPQGTPLWHTTWYNFAPRLGVAYTLRNAPGRETVVRGGGGVFFDTGQLNGSQGFGGPGFSAFTTVPGSFGVPPAIPAIVNPPSLSDFMFAVGFAPHLQLPYTLQWNASIEQALGRSQAFTVSYVGAHGSRLEQQNQFFPASNPSRAFFVFVENGLTSDYDSLQVQFRRRLSRGLTALASYTWSHCLDYGSSDFQLGYQRGNCDFDVRSSFSGAFSYDAPNVGGKGFSSAVLHGWGLDDRFTARTGFPVNIGGPTFSDPVTGQQMPTGVDLVAGEPIYLYGVNCASVLQGLNDLKPGQGCPGGRAINPNAFAQVPTDPNTGAPLRLGTAPRNFVRGFGAWQMNLAIRRDFQIYERLKLQFRAEAFNVFNHPNFGNIDPGFGGSPTFGQATATLANSQRILSPLYEFGGSRSMQFALKFVF
jgi:hypothetical protein